MGRRTRNCILQEYEEETYDTTNSTKNKTGVNFSVVPKSPEEIHNERILKLKKDLKQIEQAIESEGTLFSNKEPVRDFILKQIEAENKGREKKQEKNQETRLSKQQQLEKEALFVALNDHNIKFSPKDMVRRDERHIIDITEEGDVVVP
ncbi:hypothetical protein AGMMS50249_5220 [candidate division SR1 bacterium]|nr:hypothetical protein AGMMS50249_5220 [candidate division SR1 bacterium]